MNELKSKTLRIFFNMYIYHIHRTLDSYIMYTSSTLISIIHMKPFYKTASNIKLKNPVHRRFLLQNYNLFALAYITFLVNLNIVRKYRRASAMECVERTYMYSVTNIIWNV